MHPTPATITPVSTSFVALRYAVRPQLEAWVLPEGTVPESTTHDGAAKRLTSVLEEWARERQSNAFIARNLAVRFYQDAPRVGIDPDVCVLDPPPPEVVDDLGSLKLWKEGHRAPTVCFEIVSANHPHKDYRDIHERYAAMGSPELVVFDPLLAGPASLGGPVAIQLWRRDASGALTRVYSGDGPAHVDGLDAFVTARGKHLIVSADAQGEREYLPGDERAEKAERERDAALTRLAALEGKPSR